MQTSLIYWANTSRRRRHRLLSPYSIVVPDGARGGADFVGPRWPLVLSANQLGVGPVTVSRIEEESFQAAAPAFFFFFNLSFLLLRSLGFSVVMPALQTSAYLSKKTGRASASTMVDNFTRSFRLSLDLPLVARMIRGRGRGGWTSGKMVSLVGSGTSWPCETGEQSVGRCRARRRATHVASGSARWNHGLCPCGCRRARRALRRTARGTSQQKARGGGEEGRRATAGAYLVVAEVPHRGGFGTSWDWARLEKTVGNRTEREVVGRQDGPTLGRSLLV